jgi:hypothetical protein
MAASGEMAKVIAESEQQLIEAAPSLVPATGASAPN